MSSCVCSSTRELGSSIFTVSRTEVVGNRGDAAMRSIRFFDNRQTIQESKDVQNPRFLSIMYYMYHWFLSIMYHYDPLCTIVIHLEKVWHWPSCSVGIGPVAISHAGCSYFEPRMRGA